VKITFRQGSLTPEDTVRMAFYRGQNKSVRQIARFLNHSKTVVGDALHSFDHLFEAPDQADFMVSDFPDFTDSYPPEQWLLRHYLIYILLENPTLRIRDIAKGLEQGGFPFKVQKTKVNDELLDMSIRSVHAIHVPGMTEQQCSYRKFFATEMLTDFRILLPWLFTDEMMISWNNDNYFVRRIPMVQPPVELYARTEQYPKKIMVWAAIAGD
jgi:hypothetical protein